MFKIFSRKRTLSDAELLEQYQLTGDLVLLGELYEKQAHLVFGICMKYLKNHEESQDAVMQIFEILVNKLKISTITHFPSWLHTLTRNYCLMQLRSAKNKAFRNSQDIFEQNMESDELMHLSDEEDSSHDSLQDALGQLNEQQRQCIELFYLEKKSYLQITELTGLPLSKVKSAIQNGKRNLKIKLENNN